MADENLSQPIPDRWELVTKSQKDGSTSSFYLCRESGQQFNTYEDLMRYVEYAQANKLSIYSPTFSAANKPRKRDRKESMPVSATGEEVKDDASEKNIATFEDFPSVGSIELFPLPAKKKEKTEGSSKGTEKAPALGELNSGKIFGLGGGTEQAPALGELNSGKRSGLGRGTGQAPALGEMNSGKRSGLGRGTDRAPAPAKLQPRRSCIANASNFKPVNKRTKKN